MWHLPPDYIVEHWSRELLNLMLTNYVKRVSREVEEINKVSQTTQGISNDRIVSDKALFNQLGSKLKVVKRAN